MKYVLPVVLIAFLAFVHLPVAQENGDPIPWVDLCADTIIFDFPAPDSIEVTAVYSLFNATLWDTFIVSDVGIFLDGIPMYGQPIDVTKSYNNCYVFQTQAECKGECYYSSVPPIEIGDCTWWEYIPPPGPPDTIVVAPRCVCSKKAEVKSVIPYSGQDIVKFILDEGNAVWEPYEHNNEFSLHLRPVATEKSTWGRIKNIYE